MDCTFNWSHYGHFINLSFVVMAMIKYSNRLNFKLLRARNRTCDLLNIRQFKLHLGRPFKFLFGQSWKAASSMLRTGLHCYSCYLLWWLNFYPKPPSTQIRPSAATACTHHTRTCTHSCTHTHTRTCTHSSTQTHTYALTQFLHHLFPTFFAMNSTILTVGTQET